MSCAHGLEKIARPRQNSADVLGRLFDA